MIQQLASRIRDNIQKIIVGKTHIIDLVIAALLSEGHILLEDVPGTGKTTLAKALAVSLGCKFQRIQFTPDLLPTDISGLNYFNQKTQEFEFRPGPIMSQIILADEINRATPRTQSALLEAMQERQVTIETHTYYLERPFLVMATQNPIELEGTFPLPEAQQDRFLIRVAVGYPEEADELKMLRRFRTGDPGALLEPVTSPAEINEAIEAVRQVKVGQAIEEYIVNIIRTTRDHKDLDLGASPRATLGLYRLSQAWAAIEGRNFVLPDDVKLLAPPILNHRVVVSPQTLLRGRTAEEIITAIVEDVPVPVED
ncbi:MAG: AAA family ATPase [Phototrophicales bacterium]|nr:MAG: AAA family ATPase [Phototrophicales bacterium]